MEHESPHPCSALGSSQHTQAQMFQALLMIRDPEFNPIPGAAHQHCDLCALLGDVAFVDLAAIPHCTSTSNSILNCLLVLSAIPAPQ